MSLYTIIIKRNANKSQINVGLLIAPAIHRFLLQAPPGCVKEEGLTGIRRIQSRERVDKIDHERHVQHSTWKLGARTAISTQCLPEKESNIQARDRRTVWFP